MSHFLHADGSLILARWAERVGRDGSGPAAEPGEDALHVKRGLRAHPMYGSSATGDQLVSNGHLGVDLIRVPAGGGFAPHTHPGDHLLIVVSGQGTITYDGRIYPTEAGQVYMVEGAVAHAVGAVTDHCILAVGAPHRPVDSADRMTLVDYASVTADMGELRCLVCDKEGTASELKERGCPHTPVQAPGGRLLVVGIAPASPKHLDLPAFADTRSGDRLARLLGCEPADLLDRVDTLNLFPDLLGDWQRVPAREWRAAGERLGPLVAGRVVVACGRRVAEALGATLGWGTVECVEVPGGLPALVLTIPHPSGLSRTWNDPAVTERVTAALAVARTLASAGSPTGAWSARDAVALETVTLGAFTALA